MSASTDIDTRWIELGLDEETLAARVGCSRGALNVAKKEGRIDHLSVGAVRALESILGLELYHPTVAAETADHDAQIGALLAGAADGLNLDSIANTLNLSAELVEKAAVRVRRQLESAGVTLVEQDGRLRLAPASGASRSTAAMAHFTLEELSDDDLEIVLDVWVAEEVERSRRFSDFSETDSETIRSLVSQGVLGADGDRLVLSGVVAASFAPLRRVRIPYRDFRVRSHD